MTLEELLSQVDYDLEKNLTTEQLADVASGRVVDPRLIVLLQDNGCWDYAGLYRVDVDTFGELLNVRIKGGSFVHPPSLAIM